MAHPLERDWMVVAPWWHWPRSGATGGAGPVTPDPQLGRLTRPEIQKYDSPGFVNDFIADPQRSLKFIDEDLVHARRPAPPIPAGLGGKPRRLSGEQYVPDGTDTRKLFLATHKRFYALCCELHCDAPGFPKVARDKVCQAGFVIRRRTLKLPTAGIAEVKPILSSLAAGRATLARVNQQTEIERLAQASAYGSSQAVASAKVEALLKARGSLQALLQAEKARLDGWVQRFNAVPQLQGWVKSGFEAIGAWQPVDETPDDLGLESSFPLYPLVPDRNQPAHAGHFGTVYFGLLPTGSADTDRYGQARFDETEFYEVRCWVRRHRVPHDPDQPCPCPDGLFWSVPTRPFKLAPHFDLAGTGHRPVTVQLPDLNDLAAQANLRRERELPLRLLLRVRALPVEPEPAALVRVRSGLPDLVLGAALHGRELRGARRRDRDGRRSGRHDGRRSMDRRRPRRDRRRHAGRHREQADPGRGGGHRRPRRRRSIGQHAPLRRQGAGLGEEQAEHVADHAARLQAEDDAVFASGEVLEVRVAQIGAVQTGILQVDAAQIGAFQLRAAQVGLREIRVTSLLRRRVDPFDRGALQLAAGELEKRIG